MNAIRPTVAYISVDNITYNIQSVRSIISSGTELMAVVKADAYGHGAVEVARAALAAGANRLAVAIVDEAIELRRAQIGAPILVLGHTPPELAELVVKSGLSATVTETEFARSLSAFGMRHNRRVKVHLKVDTGMNRLGVRPQEAISFAEFLCSLPNIELEGVFTHFASADAVDLTGANRQLDGFTSVCVDLMAKGYNLVRHAANTAAILAMPESHLDMVRLGIGLYGLYPAEHLRSRVELRPVMSLSSQISLLKWIGAGEPVGYGASHVSQQESKIATVPIGYADGYSRRMSNRGEAIVNGRRVPIVGMISMDQLMLDVTEVECSPLDEVILLGSSGGEEISAGDIAREMGTIHYEVTSLLSNRITRLYLRNNRVVSGRSLLGRWD